MAADLCVRIRGTEKEEFKSLKDVINLAIPVFPFFSQRPR